MDELFADIDTLRDVFREVEEMDSDVDPEAVAERVRRRRKGKELASKQRQLWKEGKPVRIKEVEIIL